MDKNFKKVFEFKNLDKFEVAKKIVSLIWYFQKAL
jgi:hypothetical protein